MPFLPCAGSWNRKNCNYFDDPKPHLQGWCRALGREGNDVHAIDDCIDVNFDVLAGTDKGQLSTQFRLVR